jgi:hypothetical protein
MLSRVTEEGIDDVVSWLPHGRSFIVHDKRKFVEEIMPRFFHQSKFTSFQRQLNLYGFVRLTAGRDRGAYYHELFIRGRPDLCKTMVRTRVKGNGMKAASNPNQEPNFYAMESATDDAQPIADQPKSFSTGMEDMAITDSFLSSNAREIVHCPTDDDEEERPEAVSVTPHGSPEQKPKVVKDYWPMSRTTLTSMAADIVIPCLVDSYDDEDDMDDLVPKNGDEVYFEGQSFHYLDHVGFDDLETVFSASQVNAFASV